MFGGKKRKNAPSDNRSIIAEFIAEEFRFLKSYVSAVAKLFPEEQQKYVSAYNFHIGKIKEIAERIQIGIQDFEGKDFDDGLPVTPLNVDEFTKEDELIIHQTVEPAIISTTNGAVIRSGTVILAKKPPKKKEKDGLQEIQPKTVSDKKTTRRR